MQAAALIFILVFNLLGINFQASSAQIEVRDVVAFYNYAENVTFQARISPPSGVKAVDLLIQPEGQTTRIEPVTWTKTGEILFNYDLVAHPLRPFGRTYYWFRLVTDGGEITTPSYWFDYVDNRFTWQKLTNEYFEIQWQGEDRAFGQQVQNIATTALESAQKILPVAPPLPLKIYIYANAEDLQSALPGTAETWAAGHASPDLKVILLSIPEGPERSLELERQLPHEITHILEYELVGSQYGNVPVWLREGIASIAELYPNADYARVLETAQQKDSLIPMESLCSAFPRDAGSAFLAYAQSASFVRYLYQTYGSTALVNLLRQYQVGLGCREGVQTGLGISLSELENDWHGHTLSVSPVATAMRALSPYLFVALLVLLAPLILAIARPRPEGKPL